jgi:hypothetical protein
MRLKICDKDEVHRAVPSFAPNTHKHYILRDTDLHLFCLKKR